MEAITSHSCAFHSIGVIKNEWVHFLLIGINDWNGGSEKKEIESSIKRPNNKKLELGNKGYLGE